MRAASRPVNGAAAQVPCGGCWNPCRSSARRDD